MCYERFIHSLTTKIISIYSLYNTFFKSMTKEDLVQIKEVVETIVTPRFDRIDRKLEEHDAHFEGIFFAFDKLDERVENLEKDVKEIKTDLKIIKVDVHMLKIGQQAHELRFERLEEKAFSS